MNTSILGETENVMNANQAKQNRHNAWWKVTDRDSVVWTLHSVVWTLHSVIWTLHSVVWTLQTPGYSPVRFVSNILTLNFSLGMQCLVVRSCTLKYTHSFRSLFYHRSIASSKASSPDRSLEFSLSISSFLSFLEGHPVAAYVFFFFFFFVFFFFFFFFFYLSFKNVF
jgi:hypothetical protein